MISWYQGQLYGPHVSHVCEGFAVGACTVFSSYKDRVVYSLQSAPMAKKNGPPRLMLTTSAMKLAMILVREQVRWMREGFRIVLRFMSSLLPQSPASGQFGRRQGFVVPVFLDEGVSLMLASILTTQRDRNTNDMRVAFCASLL